MKTVPPPPPGVLPPQSLPPDGMVGPLNTHLAKQFEEGGVPAVAVGPWVVLPAADATAQLKLIAETDTAAGRMVRLVGTLQTRGKAISEPVLGHGPTFLRAVDDAIRAFDDVVFPVLLAAFFDKPLAGQVEQTESVIGGLPRLVTLGTFGTWGRLPEAAPGKPDLRWFEDFTAKLKAEELPAGTWWVRLFYAQADGQMLDLEVTRNYIDWRPLREAMASAPWPAAKGLYSVHVFLVIQDAEDRGQRTEDRGQRTEDR